MGQETIEELVVRLRVVLDQREWMMATAESCTGGLVGHELTNIPGSSAWYAGGVISYSNALKEKLLGVRSETLSARGAVSKTCVLEMVRGICHVTGAQVGVALSGIAGPGGGTAEKPVGTVWIGWQIDGQATAECMHFTGSRQEIKSASVTAVLRRVVVALEATF